MKELIEIQCALNVPKSRKSDGVKFAYRSTEDILKAVKPLLKEHKCFLILSDEIKEVGSTYNLTIQSKSSTSNFNGTRVYVEATASIVNSAGEIVSVKGLAREEIYKNGLESAQISGTASSYARKYALCGLLAIDDSDHSNNINQSLDEHNADNVLLSAISEMNNVKSRAEINAVWERYPQYKENPQFRNACLCASKKYPQ